MQRDPDTGFPKRVALDLVDEAGRTLHAEGTCQNGIVFPLNPNLLTINCLTEWTLRRHHRVRRGPRQLVGRVAAPLQPPLPGLDLNQEQKLMLVTLISWF